MIADTITDSFSNNAAVLQTILMTFFPLHVSRAGRNKAIARNLLLYFYYFMCNLYAYSANERTHIKLNQRIESNRFLQHSFFGQVGSL